MKEINQVLASILILSLAIGLGVLVLTQGWGLTPQNWWWIIGGGIFGQTAIQALGRAVANTK